MAQRLVASTLPTKCATCPLHHTGLCSSLDEPELGKLGRLARRSTLPPRTALTREGEPNAQVHNIVSGIVRLTKMLPDGREQIVGLMHPSDFVGCTFCEACDFSAETVTEVELCSFDKAAFEATLQRLPKFEHAFLMHVISELHAARDWLVVLGCKTGLERVATFLWLLAHRGTSHGCGRIGTPEPGRMPPAQVFEIPLTRADIARYLGLSLETVSRQISRLNGMGAIRLEDARHFSVPDQELLSRLSGLSD